MKTFLRILLCVLSSSLVIVSCSKSKNDYYNEDGSLVTQQQAIDLVQEIVDKYEVAAMSKDIVPANTVLVDKPGLGDTRVVTPNYGSWLCLINTNPLLNGGKIFLYIYVNAKTGKLKKEFYADMPYTDSVKWTTLKTIIIPELSSDN